MQSLRIIFIFLQLEAMKGMLSQIRIKLIAERTGQEFNQRKSRKGAFWEDRYHATAVESGIILLNVLYILEFYEK